MNLKGRRFENARLGMEIFVYDVDGKEWFIGKDIAKLLGYSENSKPLRKWGEKGAVVWEENKLKLYVKTIEATGKCSENTSEIAVNNNVVMVNETGLYQMIFGSSLSEAINFQRWVYEEVLPSIRKNNSYIDVDHITKAQYEDLREALMIVCENGKIGLPKASMRIFGNKDELNKRLINLKKIDRINCTWDKDWFCNDKKSGEQYPIFVCDTKGTYEDGVVGTTLQVSLTNYGFVYLRNMFKQNPDIGI